MRRLLPALASLALFIALPAPALIYYSEQNMPLNGGIKMVSLWGWRSSCCA